MILFLLVSFLQPTMFTIAVKSFPSFTVPRVGVADAVSTPEAWHKLIRLNAYAMDPVACSRFESSLPPSSGEVGQEQQFDGRIPAAFEQANGNRAAPRLHGLPERC